MHVCSMCHEEKPLDKFGPHPLGKDGKRSACKKCVALVSKKYRQDHSGKWKESSRRSKIKSAYGLEYKDFLKILESQKNACPVCEVKFRTHSDAYVDHDHQAGLVRGLLCMKCNFGIGIFNDNVGSLARAIVYLSGQGK